MQTLRAIAKNKDLRKKILIVVSLLVFVRILANIPTPGVDSEYFSAVIDSNVSLGLLNAITGGGLSSLSIVALSVTPYITSSIIIQLLTVVFPSLEELQRAQDKKSKHKIKMITFGLAGGLAFIESLAMAIGFGRNGMLVEYKWYYVLLVAMIWTAGAMGLAGLGELITDKFVGNGISLILAVNILSSFPSDLASVGTVIFAGTNRWIDLTWMIAFIAGILILLAFIVVLNETKREIPISYAGKLSGSSSFAANHTGTLPIKLCPGSVIPVIFASSLLSFPVLIASMFSADNNAIIMTLNSANWFSSAYPWCTIGAAIYIALIFGFTFFYTDITINPIDLAHNLQQQGATIPGIRPGKATSEYLRTQTHSTGLIGAAALSIVAIIPYIVGGITGLSNLSILGTSLIIVVSVVLDTKETLESKTRGSIYIETVKHKGLFR